MGDEAGIFTTVKKSLKTKTRKNFQTFGGGARHALSDGLQRLVDVGVESSQRTPQRARANDGEKVQRRNRFQATSVALRNDHTRFKHAQALVQRLFTPQTQRNMHAALQQLQIRVEQRRCPRRASEFFDSFRGVDVRISNTHTVAVMFMHMALKRHCRPTGSE